MARRLLLVADAALLVIALLLAVRLYDAWTARPPAAPGEPAGGAPAEAPAPTAVEAARAPLSTYAVVAERNLFSPNRSEATPEPPRPATAGPAAPPPPRPRLYGVILLPDGGARAYLEDVQRRRLFAYSVGDTVGDARVEQIRPDRVLLRRGGETFEVLLHDPTKPRPSVTPSAVQSPAVTQPPGAGGPARAGVRRPAVPAQPTTSGQPPGAPPRGFNRPRPGIPSPEAPPPEGQEPGSEEE